MTASFRYTVRSSEHTLRPEHRYVAWFPESQSKRVWVLTRPRLFRKRLFWSPLHPFPPVGSSYDLRPSSQPEGFVLDRLVLAVTSVWDCVYLEPYRYRIDIFSGVPNQKICYSLTCAFASAACEFKLLICWEGTALTSDRITSGRGLVNITPHWFLLSEGVVGGLCPSQWRNVH